MICILDDVMECNNCLHCIDEAEDIIYELTGERLDDIR